MLSRFIDSFRNKQQGITGLETAIILIAFVMVACVFSYVVLTAGLFSSQKAKEAVNSGLAQTTATVELRGNVIATTDSGAIKEVYFTMGIVAGGSAIDVTDTTDGKNKVIVSYSDAYHQYPSLDWKMKMINAGNNDNILEAGEICQLTVDFTQVNDGAASADEKPGPYHTFVLEVKPPDGAILTIERTVPARMNQIINLN